FSIIIVLTLSLPFILFAFYPENTRWSVLIIPGILTTVMYPKWRIVLLGVFSLSLLKYTYVLSLLGYSRETLNDLINGSIENYFIIFIVAYFIIRNSKLLKEIQNLTLIDQLTGAYNRRFFDEKMEKIISRNKRTESTIYL